MTLAGLRRISGRFIAGCRLRIDAGNEASRDSSQAGEGHVVENGLIQHQAKTLPIFSNKTDALLNCVCGTADMNTPPRELDLACDPTGMCSKNRHQQDQARGAAYSY